MVRYAFPSTIAGDPILNENGDPISDGVDISFDADYQLRMGNESVNYAGSFVRVQYKMFVPSNSDIVSKLKLGSEVTCNGSKGVIVSIFPTAKNIEIWVQ